MMRTYSLFTTIVFAAFSTVVAAQEYMGGNFMLVDALDSDKR